MVEPGAGVLAVARESAGAVSDLLGYFAVQLPLKHVEFECAVVGTLQGELRLLTSLLLCAQNVVQRQGPFSGNT